MLRGWRRSGSQGSESFEVRKARREALRKGRQAAFAEFEQQRGSQQSPRRRLLLFSRDKSPEERIQGTEEEEKAPETPRKLAVAPNHGELPLLRSPWARKKGNIVLRKFSVELDYFPGRNRPAKTVQLSRFKVNVSVFPSSADEDTKEDTTNVKTNAGQRIRVFRVNPCSFPSLEERRLMRRFLVVPSNTPPLEFPEARVGLTRPFSFSSRRFPSLETEPKLLRFSSKPSAFPPAEADTTVLSQDTLRLKKFGTDPCKFPWS